VSEIWQVLAKWVEPPLDEASITGRLLRPIHRGKGRNELARPGGRF